MHPLKTVQWHLFWNKGKSWLQHVDWCTHFSSSTFSLPCVLWAFSLALFLWALARQAFSLTWLASVKMSITLTGSFIRMSLDFKLGLFFFFFCLDTDLTFEFKERFSTSTSHPWHSQPDSLLSVSGYPRKPSAWPSLCPWDTVAEWFHTCFVLHKGNSTRILHKRNLGKSYAGLWQWSQLSR